ncbi:lactosylceramide 1,3-N-acetyl-beta-D-glucosaminyltransferase A-like [Penaeus chinensis]|uniref:lactosylceramide 1,3-N-acetyl-beta-D-glucosaminyltransferase A-like n=1 Tax=Penaeus chinensis TaxID=139456 RepID=UPI001FB74FA5|nr:lactosylceramide 1,3-N-acetyl-beta-D-glucosaminyltransferase A-like [Penaeus chinensis]
MRATCEAGMNIDESMLSRTACMDMKTEMIYVLDTRVPFCKLQIMKEMPVVASVFCARTRGYITAETVFSAVNRGQQTIWKYRWCFPMEESEGNSSAAFLILDSHQTSPYTKQELRGKLHVKGITTASGDQNDRIRVKDQNLTLISDTQQTLLHGIMSRNISFFTVRNHSSDMRHKGTGLRTDDNKELESSVKVPDAFLIEEADFCRRRPRLQVIAYVHSAISRVQERQETRSTWANATASGLGVDIAAVFMVGRAKGERERQIVQEESQRYHDIIQVRMQHHDSRQGDYVDHYRQLSLKALSSLAWVQHHCPQVPWTLHADDDVFIDVFLMKGILQDFRAETTEAFLCNSEWSRTQRSGRWAVSHDDFRNDEYPVFCSGAAWVLPTRLLPRLLRASQTAPFLWVDDVYITGILARHAGVTHLGTGYKAKHIQPSDVGDVMVWYNVKDDRRKWWKKLTRFYMKTLKKE